MCSYEAADLIIQYLSFRHFDLVFHLLVLVKTIKQGLVNGLVHPVFGLFGTMGIEVTVW